jgi:hypothetical protein
MAQVAMERVRLTRLTLIALLCGAFMVSTRAARAVDGGVLGYCKLPPLPVYCSVDGDCSHFGAACDLSPATLAANCNSGVCTCAAFSSSDGGISDLGVSDADADGGGSGYSALPIHGGGSTLPPRSGCSYLPGSAFE